MQFVQSSNIDKQFQSLWVVIAFHLFLFPGMILIIDSVTFVVLIPCCYYTEFR